MYEAAWWPLRGSRGTGSARLAAAVLAASDAAERPQSRLVRRPADGTTLLAVSVTPPAEQQGFKGGVSPS